MLMEGTQPHCCWESARRSISVTYVHSQVALKRDERQRQEKHGGPREERRVVLKRDWKMLLNGRGCRV